MAFELLDAKLTSNEVQPSHAQFPKIGRVVDEGSGINISPLLAASCWNPYRKSASRKGAITRKSMFLGFLKVISKFLEVNTAVCLKNPVSVKLEC